MEAAFAFDVARPPAHFGADHPGAEADEGERADEADQHQEDALAAVVDEVVVPEVGDEVGQRQSRAHAASPAATGSGRRFRTGPVPSRAWIRSSVSSTIATEKTGAVTMLPTASPIQAGIRPWPSDSVDAVDDEFVEGVADGLDRDDHGGDHPEVAADDLEAALEAADDAVLLELDHRPGQRQVDQREQPRDDRGDEADDQDQHVEDVDGDQFPVGDVRGEPAEARRLLVLGMGERGGDRAAEEHLAEEARYRDRGDRGEESAHLQPFGDVQRVRFDFVQQRVDEAERDEDDHAQDQQLRSPGLVGAADVGVDAEQPPAPAHRSRPGRPRRRRPAGTRPRRSSRSWRDSEAGTLRSS